jgi:hypothetical protein
MRHIYLLLILCCLSCNNERVLQLPELKNAEITEVLDVSPAYIFYDDTQTDSTLLNRKNLIITTNWLVNVDKRLTLRQAIPHIKFLQDKKRNAEIHKNEDAKNYFTCNDTSIGSLGFLEFTDANYEIINIEKDVIALHAAKQNNSNNTRSENSIRSTYLIIDNQNKGDFERETIKTLELIKNSIPLDENLKITGFSLAIYLDKELSFQDYISIKSKLLAIDTEKVIIESNEFIY